MPAPLKPRRRHSFTTNEQPTTSAASAPNPTPPPLTPRRHDLGKLLLGFLELYGRRFDYRHVGIAPQVHTGAGRGYVMALAVMIELALDATTLWRVPLPLW